MAPDRTYRCSDCLDATITRPFDVSHLSKTCDDCGSFARFVNEGVYRQYRAFEESPPEHLDWDVLGRAEKFAVSDQVVRHGRSIEDFETESGGESGNRTRNQDRNEIGSPE